MTLASAKLKSVLCYFFLAMKISSIFPREARMSPPSAVGSYGVDVPPEESR